MVQQDTAAHSATVAAEGKRGRHPKLASSGRPPSARAVPPWQQGRCPHVPPQPHQRLRAQPPGPHAQTDEDAGKGTRGKGTVRDRPLRSSSSHRRESTSGKRFALQCTPRSRGSTVTAAPGADATGKPRSRTRASGTAPPEPAPRRHRAAHMSRPFRAIAARSCVRVDTGVPPYLQPWVRPQKPDPVRDDGGVREFPGLTEAGRAPGVLTLPEGCSRMELSTDLSGIASAKPEAPAESGCLEKPPRKPATGLRRTCSWMSLFLARPLETARIAPRAPRRTKPRNLVDA